MMNAKPLRRHILKTWPAPFAALLSGAKTHEVRVDDRKYEVGDILDLMEYDPRSGNNSGFTGNSVSAVVSYKTAGGEFGLPETLCVLSLANVTINESRELRNHIDHFTPSRQ